ncbi:hypothetical protein N7G274_005833 [Stereocaulon virgatum]|uniref:Transfer RNA methyltransferase 82 n=1 Tax=Stereocaulon virgatum TaxID=373712 RepID=A0ABR4A982_9LECA
MFLVTFLTMPHPYQCLLYCAQPGRTDGGVLVAASGPYIHTFSAEDGTNLYTWPSDEVLKSCNEKGEDTDHGSETKEEVRSGREDHKRPRKRRRLSPPGEDSGSSAEIVVDGGSNANGQGAKVKQASHPPVTKLVGTSTGQYVVAVTGEDKCLRVFELLENGSLKPLSVRVMPKRPCAVVLTPDDSTTLCADKFGDIYSLPLLGQTYDTTTGSVDAETSTDNVANGASQQEPFVPAATSLTVHTKGNREALHQQQKTTNPKAEKKSLNFEHQLLLGHVSLLTDVVCVHIDRYYKNPRTYIISSDRDEHIRVSRGIPQAHMIEGYCLGHTEFVSKLCFMPDHSLFLLSGGGDDYLLLWEWLHGKMLQKIDLRGPVEAFKEKYDLKTASKKTFAMDEEANATESGAKVSIAVSNIRTRDDPTPGTPRTEIIVTCEGIPALFIFSLHSNAEVLFMGTIPLSGNIIDFVFLDNQGSILYSLDPIHEPFSTTKVVEEREQQMRPLVGEVLVEWRADPPEMIEGRYGMLVGSMDRCVRRQAFVEVEAKGKGRSMRELLYGLEGLRKRVGEEGEGGGEEKLFVDDCGEG